MTLKGAKAVSQKRCSLRPLQSVPDLASFRVFSGLNSELILSVGSQSRGVGVHFRPEIAQADERLGFAGVLECHTRLGAVFDAEVFVLGQLFEADELGAVKRLAVDLAAARSEEHTSELQSLRHLV